jgi:predicted SnoaL-like aldol condensation-catalyzing enzyme
MRRFCEISRIMKSAPILLSIAALLVACASQEGGVLGRNKALVQRAHAEVWSQKNLAAIDEIYAPDYVAHWVGGPDSRGRDTFKQFVTDAYRRAPDRSEVVDQIVAEGDLVVTRFTTRGTFDSQPDEPAQRKRITLQEVAIHRIRDGKIAEQWTVEGVLDVRYLDGKPPTP